MLGTVERLAFAFQSGNLLLQPCLVEQVGVARKNRHVLREVHARFLVHAPLVNGTRAHRPAFELRDKGLFAMQQIELVAIERLFHCIDNHIDLIVGIEPRYLIALSHRPSVALGKIGRAPRCIEMMHRHGTLLGVHPRTEHGGGAEEHAHPSVVHRLDDCFLALFVLELLYKTYLMGRDAVILHELALDFAVNAPLPGLIGAQIRENELRSLLCIVSLVILGNHPGAVGRFVVGMVAVGWIDHAHIERHFSGVVCCDEHFRLFLRFRELFTSQYRGVARLGKLHEFFDKDFLVGCGRDVVQYLVLVRTDNAHILRRAVIGDLVVERRKLRHLDEIPKTLFLNDVVRYGELEVGGLLRKNGRPRVKAADVLPFEFLGTQVLEEQVQLGERVGDGRSRKERRPQVFT